MPSRTPPYRVIDLFAGAGGLTLGFGDVHTNEGQSAFVPVWANDFDPDAVETFRENFGSHVVCGDIVDLLNDPRTVIPQADVVMGGPPCQGFSLLNKNRRVDPRKELWRPFMKVVELSRASAFVMENVRQLLKSDELTGISEEAERLGFKVASALLCAADYGVPQERYRAFVVGVRGADPAAAFPPPPTHAKHVQSSKRDLFGGSEKLPRWRTVREAIADLPEPVGTEIRVDAPPPLDLHFGRTPTEKSLKRYAAVPPGGNRFDLQANAPEITPDCWIRKTSGGTDLFGRLWWNRPSVTIRTEFYKPEKGRYLHPEKNRPITHREAARLMSFPDDFRFEGKKVAIAKQIGNAVPPLLARAVGSSVLALLEARQHPCDVSTRPVRTRYGAPNPAAVQGLELLEATS